MRRFVIATNKDWQIELYKREMNISGTEWHFIGNKEELTYKKLKELLPEKIFFTHWSHKIGEDIYKNFECILFHMTDLPYGRGGSPLQNLIVNGHKDTKLSAIKVTEELDAGDIYFKAPLSLAGSAREIFTNAAKVMANMMKEIISSKITPYPQEGKVVMFKRRKPEDGNIGTVENIESCYDHIRMLDADGYPKAFIETEHFRLEFDSAALNNDKTISANVRIIKK